MDAFFGDDVGDEVGGGYVEGGVVDGGVGGGDLVVVGVGEFGCFSFFDGNVVAGREGGIEGRGGGGDGEGDFVMVGEDGEHVSADFVRGVSVGGDAVGSGDDEVDFSGSHEAGGGGVGDGVEGDLVFEKFPGGEAEALLAGAGFAGVNVFDFALLVGGADDAEGGSVAGGGEGAGVADRKDGGLVGDEGSAVFTDLVVHGDVLGFDGLGFFEDLGWRGFWEGCDAVESPEEVHGRRAAGGEAFVGFFEVVAGLGGEGHTVGGGDTDGGSSADGHVADGVADFLPGFEVEPDFLGGEESLVEHPEDAVFPF